MSAEISPCGTYRYLLTWRTRVSNATVATVPFMMLNPSTADATVDDPTIRRCCGFAERWDAAGIAVANLYALRATDPRALRDHLDPIGPDNDAWLSDVARRAGDLVCAWGTNADPGRVRAVVEMLKGTGARLWCLGTTKDGHPRHPLYVRGSQPLVRWELPA